MGQVSNVAPTALISLRLCNRGRRRGHDVSAVGIAVLSDSPTNHDGHSVLRSAMPLHIANRSTLARLLSDSSHKLYDWLSKS